MKTIDKEQIRSIFKAGQSCESILSENQLTDNEFEQWFEDTYLNKVKNNDSLDSVSVRSPNVAYCRTYVDENGLCKRCGLDNYAHQKMTREAEAYNAR